MKKFEITSLGAVFAKQSAILMSGLLRAEERRSRNDIPKYNERVAFKRRGWLVNARVLRGGSFNNNDRNARCAYRNNNDNLNNNSGFRVVASHFSLFEWIHLE